MANNNGGQAFPSSQQWESDEGTTEYASNDGMTLLDYFAAKAMAALIANESFESWDSNRPFHTAVRAYGYAKALLDAREKVR